MLLPSRLFLLLPFTTMRFFPFIGLSIGHLYPSTSSCVHLGPSTAKDRALSNCYSAKPQTLCVPSPKFVPSGWNSPGKKRPSGARRLPLPPMRDPTVCLRPNGRAAYHQENGRLRGHDLSVRKPVRGRLWPHGVDTAETQTQPTAYPRKHHGSCCSGASSDDCH
eukprot:GHVT01026255.1.p2 GENE.GHVT01026255.1~~GHVT01026255.1.p2  ORF type:complete len:164 (-),score=27.17 GHVT01026255.1:242-733(-)